MLSTLDGDKKTDWPRYVAPVVYTYNSTKHGSTGYSPYYFMYGRHPQLPVDVALGFYKLEKEIKPYAAYADDLRAQLAHAYDLASKAISKRAKNKRSYDLVHQRKHPRARRPSVGSDSECKREA